MAEFQEIVKQFKRMCNANMINCPECPLYHHAACEFFYAEPEKFEEIALNWASEHPAMTNEQKFREVFGFLPDPELCPTGCPEEGCDNCKYRDFWNQEYKEQELQKGD